MPLPSACSSFPDFKNHEMEDKLMEPKKYTLIVNKKRIPVTKEVYKAYYQHREHEIYENELYMKNTVSLEEAKEKGISLEYIIASGKNSVEDVIIENMMIAKLRRCLEMLDKPDRTIIVELYLQGKSERQLSAETGIHYMTIHDRKIKILGKIKKLMEM
jgi:DNA-directed RNA polymerase specialized sigma24 family protein